MLGTGSAEFINLKNKIESKKILVPKKKNCYYRLKRRGSVIGKARSSATANAEYWYLTKTYSQMVGSGVALLSSHFYFW